MTAVTEPELYAGYRGTVGQSMFRRNVVEDQALRLVVEERIRELWHYRGWFRAHAFADWSTVRYELDTELRALVRLARKARKMSRPLVEANDAITASKAWTEPELREAWGR